jgi:hypothetical protein
MSAHARTDTADLAAYVDALQRAAEAIAEARRFQPDPGFDHAIERLRAMAGQATARLLLVVDVPPT